MFKEFCALKYTTIMVYTDLYVVIACELLTGGSRTKKKLMQAEAQLLAKGEVKQKRNDLVN